MEYKIPLLAKKLYKNFENKSLDEIFKNLKSSTAFTPFFNFYKPYDILVLIFMIRELDNNPNQEIKTLYDNIKKNLFAFSVVEINSDYASITCYDCNGNGEEACEECDGNGEIECSDCDGSGEDEEEEACSNCNGTGEVDCEYCNSGYNTCDRCGGSGEEETDDYKDIVEQTYVSINRDVFSKLKKLKDSKTTIELKSFSRLEFLLTYEVNGASSSIDSGIPDLSAGDYVFNGVEKIKPNDPHLIWVSSYNGAKNSMTMTWFEEHIEEV